MNDITMLHGDKAVESASESEFAGMVSPRRFRIAESKLDEANDLLEHAFRGRWGASTRLAEAITAGDFRIAAFAVLDKEMLDQYAELPAAWKSYTDVTSVSDFRPKRLISRWQSTTGFAPVPELTEYPIAAGQGRSEYAIAVAKFGRRYAISWEAWKNNEAVDEIADLPAQLARNANETEVINAVSNLLAVTSQGGQFTASDVNKAFLGTPDTKPLTRVNLKAALDAMATKKDPNSKRIVANPGSVLVVPKALESTVKSIVAPTLVRVTDDATGITTEQPNEFSSLDYVVEPMLDFVNTNAKAATTWFVVPKPGGPRPALWAATMRGYETPDLRVKADAGQSVTGGAISPLEGSFEIDDIQYRGRHIVGHQTGDALFTYVSYGA